MLEYLDGGFRMIPTRIAFAQGDRRRQCAEEIT